MGSHNNKQKLVEWNLAVTAFKEHRIKDAMEIFCTIADMSKIHFNIGVCCLNLFNYEHAELAFTNAVEADRYLAIAFYNRAWVYTQLKQYSKALRDYIQAYQVGYPSNIGLEYELQAVDIVINAGLCTVLLNDVSKARFHFKKGLQLGDPEKKKICERALELGANAPKEISFMHAPLSIIFVPQTDQISSVQEVDYLGKSMVITENNEYPDIGSEDFIFDYISEKTESERASLNSPVLLPGSPSQTLSSNRSLGRPSNPPLSPITATMAAIAVTASAKSSKPSLPPRNRTQRSNTTKSQPLHRIDTSGLGPSRKINSASIDLQPNTKLYSIQAYSLIGLMVIYGSQQRFMKVPLDIAYRDLALEIQNSFDLEITFKLSYQDQYGDSVIITDDEDFRLCIHIWKGMNRGGDVKLYVID